MIVAMIRLETTYTMVTMAILPKRKRARSPDLYKVIRFMRNVDMEIKIISRTFSVVPQKYCESGAERMVAMARPAKDSMTTGLVTVRCTDAAFCDSFLPKCSDTNLVNAVGKANVDKTSVEEMKARTDRTPRSVGVRALVFATTT